MSEPAVPHSPRYHPVPYECTRMSEDEQLAASRRFLATMAKRRTIRDYSDEPVPYELIENAIRAASLAPSGANQQPWTFVVISNPELKRQIRLAAEAEEKKSYEQRMSREWLEALETLGTDWQKPHIEQAPYVIVVFAQLYGLVTRPDGTQRKVKHYYAQESVGIAVGMLLSSLAHAGLATLTHTPSPMGFLGKVLQRPTNEHAYVLIPVGYPAPDATVPALVKKPLDEVLVHFG
ncbi:MAG: nitroreductase family protein [Ktedonobacteraceae bacterium]|nr:nitroreductase family protein [Ktedonobacteraceae bacterium]